MSLEQIITGVKLSPPRIILYGPHGIGKTTFGSGAPSPIFLPFEDGEGRLEAARFPLIRGYGELMGHIGTLYNEKHQFFSVVLDTIDWLEPLIWAEVCRRNGWSDIEVPKYGKGYLAAVDVWREVLDGLNALRSKGMQTILLAHSEIKAFADPTVDHYDRYQLKIQKRASETVQEWADAVLFATYKVDVVKTDGTFGKKIVRGAGAGERVVWTEERPSHYAKNRYGLAPEIPMTYAAVAQGIFK